MNTLTENSLVKVGLPIGMEKKQGSSPSIMLNSSNEDTTLRTFVLIANRGTGATRIAKALEKLGLPVIDAKSEDASDNADLSTRLSSKDVKDISAAAAVVNNKYEQWGFHFNGNAKQLKELEIALRNPTFIFLFSDPFDKLADGVDAQSASSALKRPFRLYSLYADFIGKTESPVLVVKGGKGARRWKRVVHDLARLIGQEDLQVLALALTDLSLSKRKLVKTKQPIGSLEKIRPDLVRGWAMLPKSRAAVELELLVNGMPVEKTKANRLHKRIQARGKHPTGKCGFLFKLPEDKALKSGDEVSVRFVESQRDLRNSPSSLQLPIT